MTKWNAQQCALIPVPIPNTAVKHFSGEDTFNRENSSLPVSVFDLKLYKKVVIFVHKFKIFHVY